MKPTFFRVFFFRVFFGEQKQVSAPNVFGSTNHRDFSGIFQWDFFVSPRASIRGCFSQRAPNHTTTGIALEIEEPKVKKGERSHMQKCRLHICHGMKKRSSHKIPRNGVVKIIFFLKHLKNQQKITNLNVMRSWMWCSWESLI